MSPYTTSSKSKTFPKESNLGDLMDFVADHLAITEREIPHGGPEPSLDVRLETIHKYIITITKIEEKV